MTLSTANPGTSVLAALDPPHQVFCYSFLWFTRSMRRSEEFPWPRGPYMQYFASWLTFRWWWTYGLKTLPNRHVQLLGWGKGAPSPNSANMPKGKVSPVVCHCSRAGSLRAISPGVNMMCVCVKGDQKFSCRRSVTLNKFQNKGFGHSIINFPHEPFWMTGGWQSKYKCNFFFKTDSRHTYTALVDFQEESVGTSDSKIKLYVSCGSSFPPKTANALIPWHSDF